MTADWQLAEPGPGVVIGARDVPGSLLADLAFAHGPPHLAGELEAMTVAELIHLFATTHRSGLLSVTSSKAERVFLFIRGQLAWASSTRAPERTNELLCRFELLGRAEAVLELFSPTPREVVRRHIRTVLAGLLADEHGAFAVFDPPALEHGVLFDAELLLNEALID